LEQAQYTYIKRRKRSQVLLESAGVIPKNPLTGSRGSFRANFLTKHKWRGMKPRSIDNFISNDRFFEEKSDTSLFRAR
jgi:hypothetical protein